MDDYKTERKARIDALLREVSDDVQYILLYSKSVKESIERITDYIIEREMEDYGEMPFV